MADKPEILQESRFVVREGVAYRAMRTGAIWMNKLFFGALVLLGVWLLYGGLTHQGTCVYDLPKAPVGNATADQGTTQSCSVFLSPTSLYLGSMAILSFVLSIGFGMLGLVVGKQVLEVTPADEEVGNRKP